MVEPPGTAPGSEPLIARAFIAIVPKDASHIASPAASLKGRAQRKIQEIVLGWDLELLGVVCLLTVTTTDRVAGLHVHTFRR